MVPRGLARTSGRRAARAAASRRVDREQFQTEPVSQISRGVRGFAVALSTTMRTTHPEYRPFALLLSTLSVSVAVSCSGGGDSAPTNTGGSAGAAQAGSG